MPLITVVAEIKKLHPEEIVMVKVGTFYNVLGKDAYILSNILGYKITEISGIKKCGFPRGSISKVKAVLEKKKINYILVDSADSYDVMEENICKENRYQKEYMEAHKYVNLKLRIEAINSKLLFGIKAKEMKSKINRIEEILQQVISNETCCF